MGPKERRGVEDEWGCGRELAEETVLYIYIGGLCPLALHSSLVQLTALVPRAPHHVIIEYAI